MISQLTAVMHDSTTLVAAASLLYATATTLAAVTALLARHPTRRRDARKVLALLLRRNITNDADVDKP
ncbi:hypothetical protein [Actinoplanes subglobosus]|uniref:Uncharacterized protein n=1 Tax=Actinoplanes subglobosus TaxID=1547892 RepID=A0ABV8ITY8_9ACTN